MRPRVTSLVGNEGRYGLVHCCAICLIYVGSVQGCRTLVRPSSRNAPRQIAARAVALVLVCSVSWLPLWVTLRRAKRADGDSLASETLLRLGIKSSGILRGVAFAELSAVALLLAPAIERVGEALQRCRGRQRAGAGWPALWEGGSALEFARDVVFSPITEEFCFRGCMCSLLVAEGYGVFAVFAVTSLLFGLAHTHHLIEFLSPGRLERGASHRQRRGALGKAVAETGVQVGFTTLFGLYACRIFLHTGSLAACILAHMTANFLGPPDFESIASSPRYAASTFLGLLLFGLLVFQGVPEPLP